MAAVDMSSTESNSWDIERRKDGAMIVRMHSTTRDGRALPDAVFTFRSGDPQFGYWEQQWRKKMGEQK